MKRTLIDSWLVVVGLIGSLGWSRGRERAGESEREREMTAEVIAPVWQLVHTRAVGRRLRQRLRPFPPFLAKGSTATCEEQPPRYP
jgi:hypothetical protein